MKAIVMETRDREAVILLKDGTFRVIKGKYSVGETIDYRQPALSQARRWLAAAAVFLLLLGTGGGLWYDANYVAYGQISLDINPSIVYTVNKRGRVLSVRAANEDAERIVAALEEGKIRFQPVSEAIESTMAVLQADGYLDAQSEDYVLINVSTDDSRIQVRLAEAVASGVDQARTFDPTMEVRIDRSDRATAQRAAENGMSPGRYAAWERAEDGKGVEEYAQMPVREIMGGGQAETTDAFGASPADPPRDTSPQPEQDQGSSMDRDDEAGPTEPGRADDLIPSIPSAPAKEATPSRTPSGEGAAIEQPSAPDMPAPGEGSAGSRPPEAGEAPAGQGASPPAIDIEGGDAADAGIADKDAADAGVADDPSQKAPPENDGAHPVPDGGSGPFGQSLPDDPASGRDLGDAAPQVP